ncbi:Carboxy-terminal domain (CTD) phosphatase [Tulasnella sp. JGI-2019a]|nr:Carboxy-terminal domain (CTD) phosphatase [Tulasnella sp. JGI-2019a]
MSSTHLKLPQSLPYPITITSIVSKPSISVTRGTPLLNYAFDYVSRQAETNSEDPSRPKITKTKERHIGTWESPIDGVIESWAVASGTTMTLQQAKSKAVIQILEECSHPMQISGMCAVCGKDTTVSDYMSTTDESRASIRMTHDAAGPTVSRAEAQRIENETAKVLLQSRKLILIVDLDQTIVHATVDPTIGEWIAEGEAWEKRQAERLTKRSSSKPTRKVDGGKVAADDATMSSESESDDDEDDEKDEEDEVNPNWEFLKDVVRFKLAPDMPTPSKRKLSPAEQTAAEVGCDYFIKMRPGLATFLDQLKDKYEMHVYTMGTRSYALKVCKAIDPTGAIFNERILTRDESGSMTSKSIERLFPYNSSMVVVIDDRADVWHNSPNLVKVIPYDFFVGIGDINATYLPKSGNPLATPPVPPSTIRGDSSTQSTIAPDIGSGELPTSTDIDATVAEAVSDMVTQAQAKVVVAQLEQRPLAKMQEALDLKEKEKSGRDHEDLATENETSLTTNGHSATDGDASAKPHHHKALLKDDDRELERVHKILDEVHRRFFVAVKANGSSTSQRPNGKGKERGSLSRTPSEPDVKFIIPSIKAEILAGVHILFSSVIPLGTPPAQSDAWRYASDFGARCHTQLSDDITHVVTAKEGTEKVLKAFQRPSIKVVWAKWFQDCIALWKHIEEVGEYLVPAPSKRVMDKMDAELSMTPPATAYEPRDAGTPNPNATEPNSEANTEDPGTPTPVALDIDWAAAADDVDAFLNDSSEDDDGDNNEIDVDEDEDASKQNGANGHGPDPREGIGRDFGDQDMDALFAEAEEDDGGDNTPYGNAVASSSGVAKKRRRSISSGSNSGAVSDTDDDDARVPSAKRKRVLADPIGKSNLNQVSTFEESSEESDGDEEIGEDGDEIQPGSKQPSGSSSSSSDSEDEDGEEGDDVDVPSGREDDSDEDFAAALSNEDGWG